VTPADKRYTSTDYELLKSEEVFHGFFKMVRLTLRHKLFSGGWSQPIERELFERGHCVGVLLYDPVNRLVSLAEQFRVGALEQSGSPWLFEVVAGMVETGESLEDVARREVQEEAGITKIQLISICDYWVSPGGTSERMHLYCALTDLTDSAGIYGLNHESEDIQLHTLPESTAFEWFDQGKCDNAATTICLMWLRINRDSLLT
jgi:ADP-ribose pyrophosphatase|tara:strand:+ start:5163 stop:5774 length:612 start_codon:yes stop_codon:yes gene_type:complete